MGLLVLLLLGSVFGSAASAQDLASEPASQNAVCVVVTDDDPTIGEPASVYFDFNAAPYTGVEGNEVYVYADETYLNQGTPLSGDSIAIALHPSSFTSDGSVAITIYTQDTYERHDCGNTTVTSPAPLCTVTTDPNPTEGGHALVDFDYSDPRLEPLEGEFVYVFGGEQYAAHGEPIQGERMAIVLPAEAVTSDGSLDMTVRTSWPQLTIPCASTTITPAQPLCVVTVDETPTDGEAALVSFNFDSPLYAANADKEVVLYSLSEYATHSVAGTGTELRFRIPNGAVQADGSITFQARTSEPHAWAPCDVEVLPATPVCTVTTDTTPAAGERALVAFDFTDPRVADIDGQVAYIYGDELYSAYTFPSQGDVVTVAIPDDGVASDGTVQMRIVLSENWAESDCVTTTTEPGELCVVDAGEDPQDGDTAVISFDFTNEFYASSDQGSVYVFSGEPYLGTERVTTGSTIEVTLPSGSVNPDGSVPIQIRTSTPVAWTTCYTETTREAPVTTTTSPPPTTEAPPTTAQQTTESDSTTTTTTTASSSEETAPAEEEASSDNTTHSIPDAGLGEGAACQATISQDMLPRAAIEPDLVTTPTQAYTSSFSTDDEMFKVLSGSWSVSDGIYKQHNNCGYDYTALLRTRPLANYRFEATLAALEGENRGGLIFGQASEDSRSGAALVDLANGGQSVRWGYYDDVGRYQNIGSAAIDGPSAGQWVQLKVEAVDGVVSIIFNGLSIAEFEHATTAGHVGLVSSVSVIGFDDVTLTALPSAS